MGEPRRPGVLVVGDRAEETTLLRMLPVAIAMGTGMRRVTAGFLGWLLLVAMVCLVVAAGGLR